MGVSKNNGTSKSSILMGFSIINHPFWGTTIFGNTHIYIYLLMAQDNFPTHIKKNQLWAKGIMYASIVTCFEKAVGSRWR